MHYTPNFQPNQAQVKTDGRPPRSCLDNNKNQCYYIGIRGGAFQTSKNEKQGEQSLKKYLLAAIVAVTTLVFATGAQAYVVSWLTQPFEVKEPISVKVIQAPTSPMWPGSVFTVDYEISNQADVVAYGMSYGGYFTYYDSGGILKFQLDKQPTKDKDPGVRLLQKPEGGKGGSPISSWGEVSFALTINGNTQPYTPYEIVNIDGKSRHGLKAKIRPSAGLPPGRWEFNLSVDRGEANPITIPR